MLAILAYGAAHLDRIGRTDGPARAATSNPGRVGTRPGGVARNAVETLGRLGIDARLVTRLGADGDAAAVVGSLPAGVLAPLAPLPGVATASYTAILDASGELVIGLADMEAYETIAPDVAVAAFEPCRRLLVDANLAAPTIRALVGLARERGVPVAAIGVSVEKCVRLADVLDGLDLLIVNRAEAARLGRHAPRTIVTEGAAGARLITPGGERHFRAIPGPVVDVNGAGDGLAGGVLAAITRGLDLDSAVGVGLRVAARAVAVEAAVDPALNWNEVAP